ncbi:Aspartate aminotransferase, cytoplasmic, partial [Nowakowskiella sp. JEL0078]
MHFKATQFPTLTLAPPDPIFHLSSSFKEDTDPHKISLGVGAYRDNTGKPWVLPVVKKAEHIIVNDPSIDHEYLPIAGLKSFTNAAVRLILGRNNPAISEKRIATIQTISGTGAVRMAGEFLARFRKAPIYISKPTWGNHRAIFEDAGLEVFDHPYWDAKTRGLAIDPMIESLRSAPNASIILLHACAVSLFLKAKMHNPTGVDPTHEQWKQIAAVIKEKGHFPLFDCAYQGFASGDLDKDAWAVRYFVEQGFELCIAQSFAKNFGLYGERCGAFTFVFNTESEAQKAQSQLEKIARAMYSNPPSYGARIVDLVLNNSELYNEWS